MEELERGKNAVDMLTKITAPFLQMQLKANPKFLN